MRELIDAAPALLADHPPLDALRLWLDRLASYGRIKHGESDAIQAATRVELAGEYYDEVIAAITLLLDACKDTGVLRGDVDADELLQLTGSSGVPTPAPTGRSAPSTCSISSWTAFAAHQAPPPATYLSRRPESPPA